MWSEYAKHALQAIELLEPEIPCLVLWCIYGTNTQRMHAKDERAPHFYVVNGRFVYIYCTSV